MFPKIFPVGAMCLAVLSPAARGTTLQVSEDTYSIKAGAMDKASGKSQRLVISPDGHAFVRFDVGDFSKQIPAEDVTGARLTFYIAEVPAAGKLGVHRVISEWTETPSGSRKAPSYVKEPLASLSAASLRPGQFVVIDVTDQAKRWLAAPEKDFGFAFVGDGRSSILIPAKEGPAGGPSATLEIDHHPVIDDSRIAAGLDAAKLGKGGVDNAEFDFLNGVSSPLQGQLDAHGGDLAALKLAANTQGPQLDEATLNITQLETGLKQVDSATIALGDDLANLATSSAGKVSKAGDTMTGTLRLPADGLKVGTNQLAITAGKVGIGTDIPSAALEVRGDVKLGAAGDLQATAGEESLRIIRGVLENQNGTPQLISGSGFTFAKLPSVPNALVITFANAFSGIPSVTVAEEVRPTSNNSVIGNFLRTVDASHVELDYLSNPSYSGIRIHFIAVGPR